MATVTFQCSHCSKLMAVRSEFLGEQVRCPHCQQVLIAPVPTPAPTPEQPAAAVSQEPTPQTSPEPVPENPPEPIFVVPPSGPGESIFDPVDESGGDSLFGGPEEPLVQMPAEVPRVITEAAPAQPLMPDLQIDAAAPAAPPVTEQESPANAGLGYEATITYLGAEPGPEDVPVPDAGLNFAGAPPPAEAFAAPTELAPSAAKETPPAAVELPAPMVQPRAARSGRGGMLVPTLLIFLVPYAIVATVAAVLLYLQKPQPSLEFLPDERPEKKNGGPAHGAHTRPRVRADLDVPAHLVAKLGQAIRVGDLEVIPQKVQWVDQDRLRLVLTMKNLSGDVDFNPVNDYFLKYARHRKDAPKPYTYLKVVGHDEQIYGGSWETLRNGEPFDGRLGPGETMTAWLTTDPQDRKRVQELKKRRGALLWRAQVRRGFVAYRGREYSATAVVGIEFQVKDIQESAASAGGFTWRAARHPSRPRGIWSSAVTVPATAL